MNERARSVFVNCPFDDAYLPSFEVLIFTIAASRYQVRCALEENNTGDIRYDKLCRLIAASDRSVHDLSRVELGPSGMPRFNMPFELGLYQGAKRFGGNPHRTKSALVMVSERFKLPVYLSDIAGNDPEADAGKPEEVIRIVRRYLGAEPDGTQLPGASHILAEFTRFKATLPELAATLRIRIDEINPYRDYRDYVALLNVFLELA